MLCNFDFFLGSYNTVPVWFLLLWKNTVTKSKLERKEFISFYSSVHHQGKLRQNSRQETGTEKQGPWTLFPGWLHLGSCSANPLLQPRTTCLGEALSTVGEALLRQLETKKMSHRHAHKLIWWRQFSYWDSLFPVVPSWQPQLAGTVIRQYVAFLVLF